MTHPPIHDRLLTGPLVPSLAPSASSPSVPTEAERIRRFEREAIPHRSAIQRTARRLAGSAADDIAQEVFLLAWRGFHRFSAGTNCRAWLYRILFCTVARHRRRQREQRHESLEWMLTPPGTTALGPEEESTFRVEGLLNQLPPLHRDLILLIDVEGFSYQEAAQRLGIPVGTVMSRLSRGRHRLRNLLTAPESRQ